MPVITFDDLEQTSPKPTSIQPPEQSVKPATRIVDFTDLPTKSIPLAQKIYRAVEPYVEPSLETAGMIGGGILGAPVAPPWGSIGGAALGYAGVKSLENAIETAIGLQQPKTIPEALKETGKEVITGSMLEMGGGIAGKAITGVAGKILDRKSVV